MQRADPSPSTDFKTLNLGGCPRRLGRRGELPKTSPLKLTEITKGPKNRNRGRQVEVVREEEEPVEIQQPQLEDEALELLQGKRSVSPILTFSPEVRQVQPEQGESSEPLSSSAAVLTLL